MEPVRVTLRGGEIARRKRCEKAWYWAWRRGLVPKAQRFSALELGAWVHYALAYWYGKGFKRNGDLVEIFRETALLQIRIAESNKAPEHVMDKANELLSLGEAMMGAYQREYGTDSAIRVIATEIPLEFKIPYYLADNSVIDIVYKIKPDLIFAAPDGSFWLMEHKTAQSIRTEHLAIDNQARPYGAMAERALKESGLLKRGETYRFKGILYNFMRKALPDLRPKNHEGKYLNQNGSVSKKQPPPLFLRRPIVLTNQAKRITLERVRLDAVLTAGMTLGIRDKRMNPKALPKTPHWSCPKHCEFWDMCKAEEQGADIRGMERDLYFVRDPYLYEEEWGSTDEIPTFEMG